MATTLEEIRKKLQQAQQVNQSEAVAKLDPAEKNRRLKRLKELFVRLKSGEDISRRDLQNALTEEQWEEFEYNNQNIDVEEPDSSNRPDELRTYLDLLKKADFYYYRAESTKKTERSRIDHLGRSGRKRLFDTADTYYERAIERLNEIFESCDGQTLNEVLSHLDRPWALGDSPNLGPNHMPRVRNSRSRFSDSQSGLTKYDLKRKFKRDAIESAIAVLKAK
jgi:hypothetical protein